jgi:hypothetical protein
MIAKSTVFLGELAAAAFWKVRSTGPNYRADAKLINFVPAHTLHM